MCKKSLEAELFNLRILPIPKQNNSLPHSLFISSYYLQEITLDFQMPSLTPMGHPEQDLSQ